MQSFTSDFAATLLTRAPLPVFAFRTAHATDGTTATSTAIPAASHFRDRFGSGEFVQPRMIAVGRYRRPSGRTRDVKPMRRPGIACPAGVLVRVAVARPMSASELNRLSVSGSKSTVTTAG